MDTIVRPKTGAAALVLGAACALVDAAPFNPVIEKPSERSLLANGLQAPSGYLQGWRGVADENGQLRTAALNLDQAFWSLDRQMISGEQHMEDGSSLSLSFERRQAWHAGDMSAASARLTAFSLISRQADGEYAVGMGGTAARYFGAGGLDIGHPGSIAAVPALANPYFSLVPSASHAGVSREVAGIKIKFGILTTGLNHAMASQAFDPANLSPALVASQPRANSHVLEFSRSFDRAAVSVSLMRSREANTYLGIRPSSGISYAPGAATNSVQLTGAWLIAPKIALAAQASFGRTPEGSNPGNQVRSNAFSLALVAGDRFRKGDRFSVSLSQPIRTYAGDLMVEAVTGVGANGAVLREWRRVSMVPTGRELLAELNYIAPAGKSATVGWSFAVRRNPNNIEDAPTETLLGVRYSKQF